MNTEILIAMIGVITTLMSSGVTYLFTKKKYNSEVDSNEIQNLRNSLDFYEEIVKDNVNRLDQYIKLAESNQKEVYRLKGIVNMLLNNSCLDINCTKRVFYKKQQIDEILNELNNNEIK